MIKTTSAETTGFVYDHKNMILETDGLGGDPDTAYNSTIDEEYGNLPSENQEGDRFRLVARMVQLKNSAPV